MRCTNLFTPSHWLKGLAVSFHLIHGHSHAHWCLSVLFLLSFYFLLKFLFHLFLLLAMVPDDSMNNPCATPQSGAWSPLTIAHPTHLARVPKPPKPAPVHTVRRLFVSPQSIQIFFHHLLDLILSMLSGHFCSPLKPSSILVVIVCSILLQSTCLFRLSTV